MTLALAECAERMLSSERTLPVPMSLRRRPSFIVLHLVGNASLTLDLWAVLDMMTFTAVTAYWIRAVYSDVSFFLAHVADTSDILLSLLALVLLLLQLSNLLCCSSSVGLPFVFLSSLLLFSCWLGLRICLLSALDLVRALGDFRLISTRLGLFAL
jgi:hypothetical protein